MPVSMIYPLKKKTGNLNNTIMKQKDDVQSTMHGFLLTGKPVETTTNEAVLGDACGDSLWDAVLAQELIK